MKINLRLGVLWESAKEPLRIILFALVSWSLTEIVPQIPKEFIPVVTLILKFIDELLHQWGKVTENKTLLTGLSRF